MEVDVADLLPADDSSYGFDNIAGVLKMSPALVERYLAAAARRSAAPRSAVRRRARPRRFTACRPRLQQHDRDDGLPLGTRGGTLVRHVFPVDAEYEIKVDLTGGGRAAAIGTSSRSRSTARRSNAGRRRTRGAGGARAGTAGPHDVGVTFFRVPPDLVEQVREPFENPAAPSGHRRHRRPPAVDLARVTIVGPHDANGPGDTPSRRRMFTCTAGKRSAQEAALRRGRF